MRAQCLYEPKLEVIRRVDVENYIGATIDPHLSKAIVCPTTKKAGQTIKEDEEGYGKLLKDEEEKGQRKSEKSKIFKENPNK